MHNKTLLATIIIAIVLVGLIVFASTRPDDEIILPAPAGPGEVTLPRGDTGKASDVTITFNDVVGDYRCAVDEECMEAGAITANVTLSTGQSTETRNIAQDEIPYDFVGYNVSIIDVEPDRVSGEEITPQEYIVTFRVEPTASEL
jgi:hypothetical protein